MVAVTLYAQCAQKIPTSSRVPAYPCMTNATARSRARGEDGSDIIKQHAGLLAHLARRFCGPGVQHDDLVQEGAFALWRASRLWRGESSLWTYARRAVFFAMLRAASASIDLPLKGLDADSVASEEDLEIATLIRECLAQLTAEERVVVVMRMGGHTWDEIGAALKRDEKGARTLFAGAVITLQERAAS